MVVCRPPVRICHGGNLTYHTNLILPTNTRPREEYGEYDDNYDESDNILVSGFLSPGLYPTGAFWLTLVVNPEHRFTHIMIKVRSTAGQPDNSMGERTNRTMFEFLFLFYSQLLTTMHSHRHCNPPRSNLSS